MHAIKLLQENFEKSLPKIHSKRKQRLLMAVESVLSRARLTLTSLGRHTQGSAYVKHKIKAIDRLLGNHHLTKERIEFYQAIANKLLSNLTTADLIVDWSPAGNHKSHILRASLALEKRSMTIYEEVHPEKLLGNYQVHKKFLANLKQVLPAQLQPTIITDAGFRTEWFKLVLSYGWNFEGRLRGKITYQHLGKKEWNSLDALYPIASEQPKYVGEILIGRNAKLPCDLYLYREKVHKHPAGYRRKRRKGNSPKNEKRYRQQHYHPWVLVTSREHRSKNPKKIVAKYRRRMKIEHEFRNLKNHKWGLGLNETKTYAPDRLAALLLIGSLAMLVLWLLGMIAERKSLHLHYQANTIKTKRVLSLIFLGLQIIEHGADKILKSEINTTFNLKQNHEVEVIC